MAKTARDLGLKSDDSVLIIAEAGVNHLGCIEKAKLLIDIAVECNSDAVKFQKRTVSRILTKEGLDAPYNSIHSFGKSYGEHKNFMEFNFDQFRELKEYADQKGIMFTASGWDEQSVDFLDDLGVPFFKMASADLTNLNLMLHTARKGKPMIISTGMSDLKTVIEVYNEISKINDKIAILQCTSTYPSEPDEVNLNVIKTYQQVFPNAVIGFSSHDRGIQISTSAVTLGAKIVEKHFTFDRTAKGNDHACSLEKPGLERLIRDIRIIEQAMGDFVKEVQESEKPCFKKLAKSIVSEIAIPAGTVITREHLTTKGPRPDNAICPMRINELIGKCALVDIPEDVVIMENTIDWDYIGKELEEDGSDTDIDQYASIPNAEEIL
jgi:sialic acid synthase